MARISLSLALTLVLVMGISASLLIYQSMQRVAQSNKDLVERALADLAAISEFRSDLVEHERLAYELYAVIDADQFRPYLKVQREIVESRIPALNELGMRLADVEALVDEWQAIVVQADKLIENIDGPLTDWDGARAQLRTMRDHRRAIDPLLGELKSTAERRAQQAELRNRDELNFMSSMVTVYTAIIILIALVSAWLLRRLFKTNETARALAQFPARNPMPVVTMDLAGRLTYANQAAHDFVCRTIGADAEVNELATPDLCNALREKLHDQAHGKVEGRIADRILAYHWYWLTDQEIFHVYIRDISAERAAEDRLRRMAFEDGVTGLMNRAAMVDRLQGLLKQGNHVHLALLGIERFHMLPPSIGFDGTERILAKLARGIRLCASENLGNQVAIARLEGGLFALCWSSGDPVHSGDARLDALIDCLPQVVRSGSVVFRARYQMGVKRASGVRGMQGESLFSDADAALRAAERDPMSRYVVHDEDIREREQSLLAIEQKLRDAIESPDGGLELYLQPKIDLNTRAIAGAEVLLRWNDNELGQITPDRFIPVAEQSGLIVDLGRWVVDRAINILADWKSDPHLSRLHLAVNASPDELEVEGYADFVLDCLGQVGAAADRLEIEVTERVMASTANIRRMDTLGKLRRAGVMISIDDFGTGYSSLGYLSSMPITHIKIDKTFVDEVPPVNGAALAQVIVHLATELNLSCVAEGVESRVQADYLQSIGCQYAQGYHFSRPQPRDAFEAMARHWDTAA
jgi:EAL domain-containing protein (putative c-di-GMP-specific phosphodiesterase class I)/GGDEF domain-containing protein